MISGFDGFPDKVIMGVMRRPTVLSVIKLEEMSIEQLFGEW